MNMNFFHLDYPVTSCHVICWLQMNSSMWITQWPHVMLSVDFRWTLPYGLPNDLLSCYLLTSDELFHMDYQMTSCHVISWLQMKLFCVDDPSDLCSINISGQLLSDVKEEDFSLFDNIAYVNAAENFLTVGRSTLKNLCIRHSTFILQG